MYNQVTIRTIAEKTKFSLTTVSRVLNGTSDRYRISKKTQELIQNEAANMGYIPNRAAKTLRSNRSNVIGLIVPSLNNPFFSNVASTLARILFSQGYVVVMSDCDNNDKEEKRIIQALLSQNLLGLIVIPTGERRNYDILKKINLPTIFIDRYFAEMNFFAVSANHYKSAMNLMDYLVKMGHQKIACIQGDQQVISNQLRAKAYQDAILKYNFNYKYLGGNSFTAEAGYSEMKLLLNKKEKPTAVLALSDTILIGVLKAIKESGFKVPNDLSVVSFDNSAYLDYLETPITSIDQPVLRIAELSAELLISEIKKSANMSLLIDDNVILLDSNLIVRSSVLHLNK